MKYNSPGQFDAQLRKKQRAKEEKKRAKPTFKDTKKNKTLDKWRS